MEMSFLKEAEGKRVGNSRISLREVSKHWLPLVQRSLSNLTQSLLFSQGCDISERAVLFLMA